MPPNRVDYAVIFDVQRFCLHDGPGIRTTVFFKGCPLRCVWCQNPESQKKEPEMAFYAEHCQACYRCVSACSRQAIREESDQRVDFERCNACGDCAGACAFQAIRQIGKEWHVDDLIHEILLDKDFFDHSGGGVTLSGGEPMQQTAFLETLLPNLKEQNIHVNLETCGMCTWKSLELLVPHLDLVYFDLKHMEPAKHKLFTKASNKLPLSNLVQLRAVFDHVVPRMPVIPGFNDDIRNIKATASFLAENGFKSIHCLPFHRLGDSKLLRIQTSQKPLHLDPPDMDDVKETFRSEGIDAILCD